MSQMTLADAIAARRAVRSFTDEIVPNDKIARLLGAAVQAPTAVHAEPWAFLIVQDRALLARLSERAKELALGSREASADGLIDLLSQPGFNIFYDAGTLIIICARKRSQFIEADCWLAAENLMLTAAAMGLGTCVIGFAVAALQLPAVKDELGIPSDVVPIAPIIVGTPRAPAPPTSRRPPEILAWRK